MMRFRRKKNNSDRVIRYNLNLFDYVLSIEGLRVYTTVDTDIDGHIVDAHLESFNYYRNYLRRLSRSKRELVKLTRAYFSISWLKWYLIGIHRRLNRFIKYLIHRETSGLGVVLMSGEELGNMDEWLGELFKVGGADFEKFSENLKAAINDLTTLTITTTGGSGKKIVTKIRLNGDIETTTTIDEDERLQTVHNQMMSQGINIMKTYAQIVIQMVGLFIPFTGLTNIDLSSILETVKSFGDLKT